MHGVGVHIISFWRQHFYFMRCSTHTYTTGLEVLASMRTLVHLALCNMVLPLTSGLSHLVRKGAAHQDPYAFSKSQGALLHLTLHACHTGGATLEELLLGGPHGEDGGGGLETNSPQQHGCQLQVLDLSESTYACKGLGMLTSLHTLIMRDAGELDDKVCYEVRLCVFSVFIAVDCAHDDWFLHLLVFLAHRFVSCLTC